MRFVFSTKRKRNIILVITILFNKIMFNFSRNITVKNAHKIGRHLEQQSLSTSVRLLKIKEIQKLF